MNMNYFPASLTARYVDGSGTVDIPFVPQDGDFLYAIPFLGAIVEGDDLEEIIAQLPIDGRLLFEVTLPSCGIEDISQPIQVHIQARRNPDRKDSLLFQCSCLIGDQELMTAEVPDFIDIGLDQIRAALRSDADTRGTLRGCFFCKFSDYEPNTGFGHLYCFVADNEGYSRLAASSDPMVRKYKIWDLPYRPVDEFYCCEQFEPRPPQWGYRG
jgi:hypothetical protein